MRITSRRAGQAALLWACAMSSGVVSAAGAWHATTSVPDMAQRNWVYQTARLVPAPNTPLAGQAITTVSWRWGLSGDERDPHMQVRLCGGGRCADAAAGRGQSALFAGLPIATPFHLEFLLPGSGQRARRLRGGTAELSVNFR